MSVRVPPGQGFWPALWLRPVEIARNYPEIDILEMWTTDRTDDAYDTNTAWMNYHWSDTVYGTHRQNQTVYRSPTDFAAGFHRFGIEWEPGEVRFYIDGVLSKRFTGATVASVPLFLVMSLQVGGTHWIDTTPNAGTRFPSYLDVDWVRAYQR